jgi:hypothetical protein
LFTLLMNVFKKYKVADHIFTLCILAVSFFTTQKTIFRRKKGCSMISLFYALALHLLLV